MIKKGVFDPKTDFKNLKYDVFGVDKNILDKIKELGYYAQLLAEKGTGPRPDLDNLIRYMMALYDKRSPLIKQFTNLEQRKKEAALAAQYDLIKDAEKLTLLYSFQDPDLQLLTIEFLKDQDDMSWIQIVSNEQTFYEYQKALLSEVTLFTSDKDKMGALNIKAKIMDDSLAIAERVEKLYIKVFGTGEEKNTAKQKDFSPEGMANRNKNV